MPYWRLAEQLFNWLPLHSCLKRVREDQPDETSTSQRVRDNFSHIRPIEYICQYV